MEAELLGIIVGVISGIAGAAGSGFILIQAFKKSIKTDIQEKEALKNTVHLCEVGLVANVSAFGKLETKFDNLICSHNASISAIHEKVNACRVDHESRIGNLEGLMDFIKNK